MASNLSKVSSLGSGDGREEICGPFSIAAVASSLGKRKLRQEVVGLCHRAVTNFEEDLKIQACETTSKKFLLSGLYFHHLQ